jgi:hypothetical protein
MNETTKPRRKRRLWPVFVAPGLFLLIALGWSAFWFYAAAQINGVIDGWRAREAQSGRIHSCRQQSVRGFPFRFEVRCEGASVALLSQTPEQVASQSPALLRFAEILVVAQIYTPNLLIAEFSAPATLSDAGRPPLALANWRTARASVAGPPERPEQVALVLEEPAVERMEGANRVAVFRADRLALHGRPAPGADAGRPAIEAVLQVDQGNGPELHPALSAPFDSQIRVLLHGLTDFEPKPWPERFREIQAAGGRIEIVQARLAQGDLLASAGGALGIAANGHLSGQLDLTVAGADAVLRALGLDAALGPLSRLVPGGIMAMLGKPATLEGRDAVALPLSFENGTVRLGPVTVAHTDPLF